MKFRRTKSSLWIVGAFAVVAVACGQRAETPAPVAPKPAAPALDPAAREAEWSWLQGAKRTLDLKREEIASLRDQVASGAAVTPQINAINQEIAKLGEEFGRRLVAYLNADFPVPGRPLKPEQAAAIRLKSAEDLLIARDYIEYVGDYTKAIEIYTAALRLDPNNGDLQAALENARTQRFITRERFAAVRKGMGQADVVKLLGRPLARDVRNYPERKITAWFYEKNDEGEAAGVFFNDKKIVYAVDFDAVKRTAKPEG